LGAGGGFRTEEDGREVLALKRPDGSLVPDVRGPRFRVPDWVETPSFIAEHEATTVAR
jgi:hypothetical protein